MKVKSIIYPTPLSAVTDIFNGNLDVFIELGDGNTYVVVVSTPNNYYDIMDNEGHDYYIGCPNIIVRALTQDIIEDAITAYAANDAYWLKCYHAIGAIGIRDLDRSISSIKTGDGSMSCSRKPLK